MDKILEKWDEILQTVKTEHDVSDISFDTWIKPLEVFGVEGNTLYILVPSEQMTLSYISKKYYLPLKVAIAEIIGTEYEIQFILPEQTKNIRPSNNKGKKTPEPEASKRSNLNPNYTFDTFVVGSNNRFAQSASLAVAESPGEAYNPLYIYGGPGLGKTHLLNAICHEIKRNDPSMKIVLTDGEEFTNEFIEALNHRTTTEFQNKYRKVDVLLMDDVQFIASKERTQEEFFHTFNALTQDGKQIVLSSDRPPKDMPQLEDRMRTRFEWGLLADVQPPDLETRMLIVKRKADALNFDISDDVVEYIAQKLKNNIRQLESAVKKMQAYVQIQGAHVNTATAQQAIRDILSDNKPIPVVVDKIITEVARTYGANPEDLRSKKKDAQTSKYRQISMYIVREVTGLSAKAIGAEFGGRHYSTVLYALDEIKKESDTDSALRTTINDIIKNVQES